MIVRHTSWLPDHDNSDEVTMSMIQSSSKLPASWSSYAAAWSWQCRCLNADVVGQVSGTMHSHGLTVSRSRDSAPCQDC